MARLQSSGTMSLSDIIFNRSDALPSTNGNYTFSGESNTFASGATVGDQDNYNNVGDLTDRNFQNMLKEKQLPWLLSKSFSGSAVVSEFIDQEISDNFWIKINAPL